MALNNDDLFLVNQGGVSKKITYQNLKNNLVADEALWELDGTDIKPVNDDHDLVINGDVQMESQNGGPLAGFRNQIINGDFNVWQRGINFAAGAGNTWTADRWNTGGGGTAVQRSNFDNNIGAFGLSFQNAAGGGVFHAIELPGAGLNGPFLANTTWTLSWFEITNTIAANPILPSARWSDNSTGGNAVANNVSAIVSGREVGNWTRRSCQVTISANPAGTSACLLIGLTIPGNVQKQIAGVQFEAGPVATPFEHRPIGTEIALCQRYFCKTFDINETPGTTTNIHGCLTLGVFAAQPNTYGSLLWRFPVEMRRTPDMVFYAPIVGGNGFRSAATSALAVPSVTPSTVSAHITFGTAVNNDRYDGHATASAEL